MGKIKVLHCADLHIGAVCNYLGTKAVSRRQETLNTFEKTVGIAKENKVDIILIAGDLFNSNNVEKSFVDCVFDVIKNAGEIKFVFSAGNHDPINSESPFVKYALPENLYVMPKTAHCFEFPDINTRVYGVSFAEVYKNGTDAFPLTPVQDECVNLMCIHGELRSDLSSDYNSITDRFISNSGMDYIALGHIHKRTDIGMLGKTRFAYCGCAEGQGFDEDGKKGVYLIEISKDDFSYEFIPVCKRMHITEKVDINPALKSKDAADIVITSLKEKYGEDYTENLYKIILCGEVDEDAKLDLSEIKSQLEERVYFAKVKDCTEIKTDFELLSREKSLKGIFVKKMLELLPENQDLVKKALNLGLRAFETGVNYDENQ